MKLYVWEDVLSDHTSGMAVVLAPDIKTARAELAKKLLNYSMAEIRNTKPTVVDVSKRTRPAAWYVYGGS